MFSLWSLPSFKRFAERRKRYQCSCHVVIFCSKQAAIINHHCRKITCSNLQLLTINCHEIYNKCAMVDTIWQKAGIDELLLQWSAQKFGTSFVSCSGYMFLHLVKFFWNHFQSIKLFVNNGGDPHYKRRTLCSNKNWLMTTLMGCFTALFEQSIHFTVK